jgi:hypothetical protein
MNYELVQRTCTYYSTRVLIFWSTYSYEEYAYYARSRVQDDSIRVRKVLERAR